jgi:hypothetical protein
MSRKRRLALPAVSPYNCFHGQSPSERALIFLRHHWLLDIVVLVQFCVWMLFPVLLFGILSLFNLQLSAGVVDLLIFLCCWYVLVLALVYYIKWINTYLDYMVITTDRIIDVQQERIFGQSTAEMPLSEIQDVSCHVRGFWASMLDYGDIFIQTAGELRNFEMFHVPHPTEYRSKILAIHDRYEERMQAVAFQEAMHEQEPQQDHHPDHPGAV